MNCFRFGQVIRDDSPPRQHHEHHRGLSHAHSWRGCTRPVLVDDAGDEEEREFAVRPGVQRSHSKESHSKEKERRQQQQQQAQQGEQQQAPGQEQCESLEREQQRRVNEGSAAEQRIEEGRARQDGADGARDGEDIEDGLLGGNADGLTTRGDAAAGLPVTLDGGGPPGQLEGTGSREQQEQELEQEQHLDQESEASGRQGAAREKSRTSPVPPLTIANSSARHVQFQQQQPQESSKHSKQPKQDRWGLHGGFRSAPASPMFRTTTATTTTHSSTATGTSTGTGTGSTIAASHSSGSAPSAAGAARHPLQRRSTTPTSAYHHSSTSSSTSSSPRITRSSPGPSARSVSASSSSSRPASRDGMGSGSMSRSLRRDGGSGGGGGSSSSSLSGSSRRGGSSGKGSAVLPLPGSHNLPGILTRNFSRNSSSSTSSTPPLAPTTPGAYPPKSPSVKERERREREKGERGGEVRGEREKGRGGSVGSSSGRERGPLENADIETLKDLQLRFRLHIFSYAELRAATRNFAQENLLGSGGFGRVYRGEVVLPPLATSPREDGHSGEIALEGGVGDGEGAERGGGGEVQGAGGRVAVAVKKLNSKSMQGHKEWMVEVSVLAAASHPHLVRLIGCCAEGDRRLLVYELLPHGSLDRFLFRPSSSSASASASASGASAAGGASSGDPGSGRPVLDWGARLKVALGAARGLAYLHEEMEPKVIYRDLKTSNVLLTSSLHAKLSDFGLAREGPDGESEYVSTMVRGTAGYAAPEYILTGQLTSKHDVWSFGVLLLELLTGRPSIDSSRPHPQSNLVLFARPYMQQPSDIIKIIDPALTASSPPPAAAAKVAEVARWCLAMDPTHRPVMSQVVDVLTFLSSQQWS